MTQTTRICWFKNDDNDATQPDGFTEPWYLSSVQHRPHRMRLRIALCQELVTAVKDPNFAMKPPVEQCAVHINIAITLLHELAHCMFFHREREYLIQGYERLGRLPAVPEPHLSASLRQELGFMFEISLMGGVVRSGHYTKTTSTGLIISRTQYDGSQGLQLMMPATDCSEQEEGYTISDYSILALLHEDTWKSRANVPLYLLPRLTVPIPKPGMNTEFLDSIFSIDQVPVTNHGLLINQMVPVYRSNSVSARHPLQQLPNQMSQFCRSSRNNVCQKHVYSQASINNRPGDQGGI